MKKRITVSVLAAGCSLLLVGSGFAADQMSGQTQQQDQQKQQQQAFGQQQKEQTQYSQQLSSPDRLSKAKIQDQQGQELGKVEQVLLDSQEGNVKFVLMKSKTGDAMEIIPWDALKLQQQQGQQQDQITLVLQQKQEKYSSPDYFKNAKIQDSHGQEFGTVESTLVDVQEGKLAYVMVKTKSGPEAIIPFNALKMQQGQQQSGQQQQAQQQQGQQQQAQQGQQQGQVTLVLQGQAPELMESPEGKIPDVLDRKQGESIHQYYGVAPYWEGGQQQGQQQQPLQQQQQQPQQQQEKEKEKGSLMN